MGSFVLCLLFFIAFSLVHASGKCVDYPVINVSLPSPKGSENVFRIGAFGTFTTQPPALNLMNFTVHYINNNPSILPNVTLEFYYALFNISDANALLATQALIETYEIDVLLGGVYAGETRVGGLVSTVFNVPQVVPNPLSTLLSNRIEYPNLVRVIPPDQWQAKAIIDMFNYYGWRQVLVINSNSEYGIYGLVNLKGLAGNITIFSVQTRQGATNYDENVAQVKEIATQNRVRIFVHYIEPLDAVRIMETLNRTGLVGPGYVHILTYGAAVNSLIYKGIPSPTMAGAIVVSPRGSYHSGALYEAINQMWVSSPYVTSNLQSDPGPSWYSVDAVMTIAYGLDNVLGKGINFKNVTSAQLLQSMRALNFSGVTGNVYFDQNSDRVGQFFWYNIGQNGISDLSSPAAIFDAAENGTTILYPLVFPGGATEVYDGVCSCFSGACDDSGTCLCNPGYSGVLCDHFEDEEGGFSTGEYLLVTLLPAFVVIIIVGVALQYTRYKRKRMIKDMSEKQRSVINRADIKLEGRIGRGASGEVFKAQLRGTEVAVKRLVTTSTSKEAVDEFELECAIMTGLRHPNIVLFMGSCFVAEHHEMLLVMEFMERGSLYDVIQNPKIHLSPELRLHIAYQAGKGMNFLHQSSPAIIHRDLKSHNILMDDKWNARISDFGITKIKRISGNEKKQRNSKSDASTKSLGTIYWTAPEVFDGYSHTEASDCYSFGIVLWELFHRQLPYAGRDPMSVAVQVPQGLRPEISPSVEPAMRDLIRDCWHNNPEMRPNFEIIVARLKKMATSKIPVLAYTHEGLQTEAPTGVVYFVCTDIEGANELWDACPMEMLSAMGLHNKMIRTTLESREGYEAEFRDNGFSLVFEKLQDALNWCVETQTRLLQINWPDSILKHPMAKTERGANGSTLWAGIRVRMAVHTGLPNCEVDRSSGRMTYFGPVVDKTKKILHSHSHASILLSSAVMEQVNKQRVQTTETLNFENCAEILDSTRTKMEAIYKALPASLSSRFSNLPKPTPTLPHAVILMDADNMVPEPSPRPKFLSWLIPLSSFEERETVGKGAIGDYHRCVWNGQEVVEKFLLNQKLEENDLLSIKAHASVLSKIKHKNLLDFYGVCLDPEHVALLTGYLPKSGLNALLVDESFPLSFSQKVKLAKQIAEGMEYLSSSEHSWLAVHSNLKSNNVLVVRDRLEVKLCDFGQGNLKDMARTMTSVGTVAWTAPEILDGLDVTPKIAVYSFGIILWEIYTRKVPYVGEHPIKVVSKIISGFRPAIPTDCPPAFKLLIEQCWANEPLHRPKWREILDVLDAM